MDILILDSWLREHLDTSAKPKKIAECLSLSGPSVEKVESINNSKDKKDYLYHIEITTNRIDMVSVRGIAREAAAILPRFGLKASLKPVELSDPSYKGRSLPLKIKSDPSLVMRTMGVIMEGIDNWETPDLMKKRLESAGVRSLNAVVDITNYVMLEMGHPSHVFDYDKIEDGEFKIRESKNGEKVTSLEGKTYELTGGDIIFENKNGEIIDLPGIIGTENSVVDKDTKRILFFTDTNDPARIRKTSMSLGIRTMAASINEKSPDPKLAEKTLLRGLYLYKKVCNAKQASKVYDNYKNKYKPKKITVGIDHINEILGIKLEKIEVKEILESLEFDTKWSGKTLSATVPSFRANDINIPEDIIEEIARIYGYHRLPSRLMEGALPAALPEVLEDSKKFEFEHKIKQLLSGWGGVEVYTLSLVPEDWVVGSSLKIKNPLGTDSAFLRTDLRPSLINAADNNRGEIGDYHLFELANIYKPETNSLPEERMKLAGIMAKYDFRHAKGIVEALLEKLNIRYKTEIKNSKFYKPNRRLVFKIGTNRIGEFGELANGYHYYSFDIESLRQASLPKSYTEPAKYPPQIEDITFQVPDRTTAGAVTDAIKKASKFVNTAVFIDSFKNNYTFRIFFQHPDKTLTDSEVEELREQVLNKVRKDTGAEVRG